MYPIAKKVGFAPAPQASPAAAATGTATPVGKRRGKAAATAAADAHSQEMEAFYAKQVHAHTEGFTCDAPADLTTVTNMIPSQHFCSHWRWCCRLGLALALALALLGSSEVGRCIVIFLSQAQPSLGNIITRPTGKCDVSRPLFPREREEARRSPRNKPPKPTLRFTPPVRGKLKQDTIWEEFLISLRRLLLRLAGCCFSLSAPRVSFFQKDGYDLFREDLLPGRSCMINLLPIVKQSAEGTGKVCNTG